MVSNNDEEGCAKVIMGFWFGLDQQNRKSYCIKFKICKWKNAIGDRPVKLLISVNTPILDFMIESGTNPMGE